MKITKIITDLKKANVSPVVYHDPKPQTKARVCGECGSRHSRVSDVFHHYHTQHLGKVDK